MIVELKLIAIDRRDKSEQKKPQASFETQGLWTDRIAVESLAVNDLNVLDHRIQPFHGVLKRISQG